MTCSNAELATLRSLEDALAHHAARVPQTVIADRVGLCGSAQVSRKMTRVLDGDLTWGDALRARELVLLARHDEPLRHAVAEAITPAAPRADGTRVTADLVALIAATTTSAATAAVALADGHVTADELRQILATLDRLQAEIDHMRRDALARLGGVR